MSYLSTGPQPVKFHKPLAAETADISSLRHAHDGGSGHRDGHHNGRGRRRHRPRVRNGLRQAVLQADTALLLVQQHGFSIADAARRAGASRSYVAAVGLLHDYGDTELLVAVLAGELPLLPTAARIKPLIQAAKAFNNLSDLDRIEWARREGAEKLFNEIIIPASTA